MMAADEVTLKTLEFYCHLFAGSHQYLFKQYCADNVVLDWFGRTIAGKDQVADFMVRELSITAHDFPLDENIHLVRQAEASDNGMSDDSGFDSTINESCSSTDGSTACESSPELSSSFSRLSIIPPTFPIQHVQSPSVLLQTPQNKYRPPFKILQRKASQCTGRISGIMMQNLDVLEAKGVVAFTGRERVPIQWSRDCNLKLGYNMFQEGPIFSAIKYFDDIPCRRNLASLFE